MKNTRIKRKRKLQDYLEFHVWKTIENFRMPYKSEIFSIYIWVSIKCICIWAAGFVRRFVICSYWALSHSHRCTVFLNISCLTNMHLCVSLTTHPTQSSRDRELVCIFRAIVNTVLKPLSFFCELTFILCWKEQQVCHDNYGSLGYPTYCLSCRECL